MCITIKNNNIVLKDDNTVKSSGNTPAEDNKPKSTSSPYPKDALFISYIRENHDMHWYSSGNAVTNGVRFEAEEDGHQTKNAVIKAYRTSAANISGNSDSINLQTYQGIKIKAGVGEIANAYISGSVGINVGWLDSSFTGGIGGRGAVGAELGPVYAEAFKEASTNYDSAGCAMGIRYTFK